MNNEELNLSTEVSALSQKLEKALKVEKDGTITPDKDLYKTLLPEGLTMDSVKAVQKHNSDLTSATAMAVGNLASDFLKKHKDIDEVTLDKFAFGRDFVRGSYKRAAEVSGIGGSSKTRHGWMTFKYSAASAGVSGAAFKRIREHHAQQGDELFGE